jgi:hypothetical protein
MLDPKKKATGFLISVQVGSQNLSVCAGDVASVAHKIRRQGARDVPRMAHKKWRQCAGEVSMVHNKKSISVHEKNTRVAEKNGACVQAN